MTSKVLYLRLTEEPYWSKIDALTEELHCSVAKVGLEALQIGLAELSRRSFGSATGADTLVRKEQPSS